MLVENPVNPTNDPDSGITFREQDFEFIGIAGKWSRLLSIAMAVLLSLAALLVSSAILFNNRPNGYRPTSSDSSSGFEIRKSYFFEIDAGGYIFLLCGFIYWGVLIHLLFRFSSAAKAVKNRRQGPDFTDAMMQLNWILKLLVIGLMGGLGLVFLPML